jgi:Protein of unknown function (DUF2783)
MNQLITTPNLGQPGLQPLHAFSPGDDFYEQLVGTHHGLSDEDSRLLNARLLLLLANHIGDLQVLSQALKAARAGLNGGASEEKVLT